MGRGEDIDRDFLFPVLVQLRWLGWLAITINLALPVFLYLYAAAFDQAYWRMYRGEDNLVEWFSGVQLLLIAGVAYANAEVSRLAGRSPDVSRGAPSRLWHMWAIGFLLLALDERFDLHEWARDYIFRPAEILADSEIFISGDVGLYLAYVVGLVMAIPVYGQLRSPWPRVLLIAAFVLALPSIVIDSLADIRHWPAWRFWDYTFEELGEVWAGLLFLLAFLDVLRTKLSQMQPASPHASEEGA